MNCLVPIVPAFVRTFAGSFRNHRKTKGFHFLILENVIRFILITNWMCHRIISFIHRCGNINSFISLLHILSNSCYGNTYFLTTCYVSVLSFLNYDYIRCCGPLFSKHCNGSRVWFNKWWSQQTSSPHFKHLFLTQFDLLSLLICTLTTY